MSHMKPEHPTQPTTNSAYQQSTTPSTGIAPTAPIRTQPTTSGTPAAPTTPSVIIVNSSIIIALLDDIDDD